MQKVAPTTDTRKKKKHKKRKRGNTQVGTDNCPPTVQEENRMYHDLSAQKSLKPSTKNVGNCKLPSMGMSVIRQQSQQPYPGADQTQPPTLPTSTKSEKKLFANTAHQRRRRRHRSSEDEPHETTSSISPSSSTGKIYDQRYQEDDPFDDNLSENFQGI